MTYFLLLFEIKTVLKFKLNEKYQVFSVNFYAPLTSKITWVLISEGSMKAKAQKTVPQMRKEVKIYLKNVLKLQELYQERSN